uniref:autophagy-related protein 9A-like n=1 Tax=Oncorhynchus gorbuscha TaxID=8017 RepID=UPI001EAEB620|nr:autophagy-related protein 9A-like [Oncorhynchus gorbuscha]
MGQSVTEEGGSGGGNVNPRKPIPRSHTFPISTPGPIPSSNSGPNRGTTPGQEVAPLQSNSQRRYGGNTDSVGPGGRVVRSERVPMGGWAEERRGGRHPDTVPEERSEDDMPPNIHKVT